MYWVKLTQTERKRLNDAYVEQAAQLQLSGREELPRDVKRKVRADVRNERREVQRPYGQRYIVQQRTRLPGNRRGAGEVDAKGERVPVIVTTNPV